MLGGGGGLFRIYTVLGYVLAIERINGLGCQRHASQRPRLNPER